MRSRHGRREEKREPRRTRRARRDARRGSDECWVASRVRRIGRRTVTITKFRRATVCTRVTNHRNFRALFGSAACRVCCPGGDFSFGHCSDSTSPPQTDCRRPIVSVPDDLDFRRDRSVIDQDRACTYDLLAAIEFGVKRRQPAPLHRQLRKSLHRRLRTISHDSPPQSVPGATSSVAVRRNGPRHRERAKKILTTKRVIRVLRWTRLFVAHVAGFSTQFPSQVTKCATTPYRSLQDQCGTGAFV